jgi:hypothetical protein
MPSSSILYLSILNLKWLRGMRRIKYILLQEGWFPIIRTKASRKWWKYRLKRKKKLQHWCPASCDDVCIFTLYKKNSIDRTVTVILYTFYFVPSWSRLKKTPVKALVVYLPKEREEDWKQIKIKESDRERQRKKRRSSRKIFHLYTSNHLHDVITIFPLFPDWMIVVQPSYL